MHLNTAVPRGRQCYLCPTTKIKQFIIVITSEYTIKTNVFKVFVLIQLAKWLKIFEREHFECFTIYLLFIFILMNANS